MNWRDQLRDWLSGCWEDFWNVPPHRVWLVLAVIFWALTEAVVRTAPALGQMSWATYHALWPVRIGVGLALVIALRRAVNR